MTNPVYLYQDFETRSQCNLEVHGLDRYVKHPTTEAMMNAWAVNDDEPKVWQRHIDGPPSGEFKDALTDPHVIKIAWNSEFERLTWLYVLGTDVPLCQWLDPAAMSRHLSAPGNLEESSKLLGLEEEAKMSWGTKKDPGEAQKLIKMFCEPAVKEKDTPLFGVMPAWYRDWDSDPERWNQFVEYCKRDLTSMRTCFKKMLAFPLPESERRGWVVDQTINERGLPMDMDLVNGSYDVAGKIKTDLFAEIKSITGLENPNSGPQMLKWLDTQGYDFSSIGKAFVNRALAGECELTPEAIKVLTIRKQASKTSDSKLQKMVDQVSEDGRLRHQFIFMGASRTGRWSGGGGETKSVQMQNLPRPVKEVAGNLDLAISMLKNRDYAGVSMEFSSPMDVVTSTLRSTIKPKPGKKLLVCDLNAVEFRKLGWITKCESINSVFRTGRCPYKDFAVDLFGVLYEEVTKQQRQDAKAGVLGGGYQLSGGEEFINEDGDKVYSGLMAFARMIGIEISKQLADESISRFRAKYSEVKGAWYEIEDCALEAVRKPGTVVRYNDFTWQCFGTKLLRLTLPSGRGLHYIRPKIEKDEKFKKDGILYWGKDQKTKQWCYVKIYGGKWVENMCQASSRDLLLGGLIRAEDKGMTPVAHTHDEIVCEVDVASKFGLDDLIECMVKPFDWCPDLLLGADGYSTTGPYRKD